ncbi:MAG: NADPH-dependent glutamate synthase [Candidatus Omnitrophica bacterium]|nr:NADPH-dependent glutamate synthase [Candidatus Omnitrophota bacterium]
MTHLSFEQFKSKAKELLEKFTGKPLSTKDKISIPMQEMPTQEPLERIKNMSEVALGYSPEQAKLEALRCLECKNLPCIKGCPVQINIPGFIKAIADGDNKLAIDIIKRNSLLPAVCGRVCPQETQCQELCTIGKSLKDVNQAVSIGRLERFVADWERDNHLMKAPEVKPETHKKVAVIGSGPAGITVAADVRREGHSVTIFEAFHKPGGVLIYGIPEFRLPKKIVEIEIETLKKMGVEIKTNFVIGRTKTLPELLEKDKFDAIFIGTGAGLPKFLEIEGENAIGVFSANEYLTRSNLMRAYDREHADTPIVRSHKVAVLGGGNVAMDAARTALRLGAQEVHLIYRRTEVEMPARVEEVAHAKEEGVQFHFLENAKRIISDDYGCVKAIECLKYQLGEPDSSGRRRPIAIKGSEFLFEVDTVIVAVGNESNPLIKQTTPDLKTNEWGNIIADANGKTSMDRVFAGGDIVIGAATVILAMGQGRIAAKSINELLSSK